MALEVEGRSLQESRKLAVGLGIRQILIAQRQAIERVTLHKSMQVHVLGPPGVGCRQDLLVQYIDANIPVALIGEDPARKSAEDGRLRLADQDDQPDFGKTIEHQLQRAIVRGPRIADFFEAPARGASGGVGEKRTDKGPESFQEFLFAREIVPGRPATAIAQLLDALLAREF